MASAASVRSELRARADPAKAAFYPNFFRTGKGEYGEGDRFLGVTVPHQRKVARQFRGLELPQLLKLLDDRHHECRLTALFILVLRFEKADETGRTEIAQFYLSKLDRVNSWDLVDATAAKILGSHLERRDRGLLDELAATGHLWRQRVAVIATYHFIRLGQFDDTLRLADTLLLHEHDLIHKAVGWMLREVGNRDHPTMERFLKPRYKKMPRTMLRYAIEKLPGTIRRRYLEGKR